MQASHASAHVVTLVGKVDDVSSIQYNSIESNFLSMDDSNVNNNSNNHNITDPLVLVVSILCQFGTHVKSNH